MSDRNPYDGGDNGRRGRRRASDPDPLDDGGGARPRRSSGANHYTDPYADPRTDPWRAAQDGRSGDPLTDPWRRAEAPGSYDSGGEQGPPPWDGGPAARPRGRRHRGSDAAEPGPATGPQPQASSESSGQRAHRRRARSEEDAEDHLAWSRSDPADGDDDFRPVQPRALDFDAVPVRRKRSRGEDTGDEPRGGRRRRSGDTGAFPTVPEQGPALGGADDRRRGPESGGFAAADVPETEPHSGEEPRGGRRRRRGDAADTGAFGAVPPRTPEDEQEPAPRRRRSRRQEHDRSDDVEDTGERYGPPAAEPWEQAEPEGAPRRRSRPAPADTGRGRRRNRRAPAAEPESDAPGYAFHNEDGTEDDDSGPAEERSRRRGDPGGRGRGRQARPAKKRTRRRRLPIVLICLALVALLTGGGYLGRIYVFPPDYDGQGSGNVEVIVAEGSSGSAVAQKLADKGVVASPRAFLNALYADGGSLAPGTYRMHERMSGEAAVAMLMDPSARVQAHITFKEGLRSEEMLTLLSEKTGIPMKNLRAALEDGEKLGLPDYAEQGAEGYLFPDTYDMPPDAGAVALLKRMVDRYHEVAEDVSLQKRAEELNLTPNEAMAVAAVVQAESGSAEDMPKVARVVYNRLQAGMELGMDSTCFYVLDEYGIALTSAQVERCKESGSEYATYGRKGLPAGPIVSPGRDAIEASLDPAEGDWRFFVATDPENGVTKFAETYDEFVQLKQEFERNRGDA
ncbi:endolytic transglycosylase MltG [Streptomonospora alba]|uniref:endolytic transglycosylase MltG n=1 Tax=Streptomonospora alba TaxID=183763 RepID=UPI00058E58A2|nr:endolytic transglycosylase MltG [Streptomonospora alba]